MYTATEFCVLCGTNYYVIVTHMRILIEAPGALCTLQGQYIESNPVITASFYGILRL